MRVSAAARLPAVLALTVVLTAGAGRAQEPDTTWDVTQPRGATREIDFTTTEGTWMSVDLSPDGRWIVFDLLGHVYGVPSTGERPRPSHRRAVWR